MSITLLGKAIARTRQWSYLPLLLVELFFITQIAIRSYIATSSDAPLLMQDHNNPIQSIGWLSDLLYISVATLACVLIVVRKQVLEINKLSLTDQLTGCYNRRAMQESATQMFAESKRLSVDFGLIMIDIDFF